MIEPEPKVRRQSARLIAAKAKDVARESGSRFISVKTWHDPSILSGLIDEGFQLAEIGARLSGTLEAEDPSDDYGGLAGLSVRKPKNYEFPGWFDSFGELFYDGHLRHGPFLDPEFQNQLWREVAMTDMRRGQPFVFLWQDRPEKPVGLAWGSLNGHFGVLQAIHIAEERRGQGLGRHLAKALFSLMRQMGAREIAVETASWNLPALRLYQALGLKQIAPLAALHLSL